MKGAPKQLPDPNGLNPKQRRFVEEYLVDFNGKRAYEAAYGTGGTSAEVSASRLLSSVKVRDAVQQGMARQVAAARVTQDRVLAELARVAYADMRDFAEWGPEGVTLKPSAQLSEDAALAVAEVSQRETKGGRQVTFKLHDKLGALIQLGRHLGMFTDKAELSTKDGQPLAVQQVLVLGSQEIVF